MARKRRKIQRFHNKSRGGGNNPDAVLKQEVYGVLLVALGILFALAIVTYNPADPVIGQLAEGNEYQAHNLLGTAGATLARPIFQTTFGYAALVFPFLLMLIGIRMMGFLVGKLLRLSLISLGWAYFFALVLAMPEALRTGGHSVDYFPSGIVGGVTADLIAFYFGKFALIFLSGVFFLIMLMVTFQFRISTVPISVAQSLQRFFLALRTRWNRLVEWVKSVQWLPERPPREERPSRFRRKRKKEPPPSAFEGEQVEPVHSFTDFEEGDGFEEPPGSPGTAEPPEGAAREMEGVPSTGIPSVEEPLEHPLPDHTLEVSEEDDSYLFPMVEPPGEETAPSSPEPQLVEPVKEPEIDYDEQVRQSLENYQFPSLDLLNQDAADSRVSKEELMANADLLEKTLEQFGVRAFVKKVIEGPVITLYAVRPAEGVKINQIVSLADDLALAMRAKGIRMIAPIPGEAAIGIEIPNRHPSIVWFKSIARSEKFQKHPGELVLGMGKTIGGDVFCADLTRMPHLLVAGATGSGKSVGINTMIASILYRVPPSDVKFVLIDPKKLELSLYAKLKDHYLAICPELDEIVITHPQNAVLMLRSVVNEMEERYDLLAQAGVRDIVSYNQKLEKLAGSGKNTNGLRRLPYLVVIIDELADLILTASREVEEPITRLAQMARAVGIHLIVATQRPSVDILTGLIKANFPTRIAYQVATRPDSKVILDMYGAEKLIGNGDMLFLPPGTGKPVRLQNPLITTEEIERIIQHIRQQPKFPPYELKLVRPTREVGGAAAKKIRGEDDLFERAKEIVIRHQQGSISLLQRKLKIGYARAARLIDELEEAGIVGPGQGSKARDVLKSSLDE
ncbi:MAG: DNA translocase FtsK [Calditrichaeota bacterium]|nr:MAG: DNA translocase FtsK [Calditrichota bacterium]